MHLLWCLFLVVYIQITSAQVIPYMQRIGIAPNVNGVAGNQPQNLFTAKTNLARSPGILGNLPSKQMPNAIVSVNTNPQIANVINKNAVITAANQDLTGAVTNANLVNIANTNLANGVANANLAALAGANLGNINGNMASFDFGNGLVLTSGSPGSPGFGIQVLADALEVGGTVAVNGKMPIFGTVAINGVVPTDGSASVSYNCGNTFLE